MTEKKGAKWARRWMVLKMCAPGEGVDDEGEALDDEYSPTLAYYETQEAFEAGAEAKGGVDIRICGIETSDASEIPSPPKDLAGWTYFSIKTPTVRRRVRPRQYLISVAFPRTEKT